MSKFIVFVKPQHQRWTNNITADYSVPEIDGLLELKAATEQNPHLVELSNSQVNSTFNIGEGKVST